MAEQRIDFRELCEENGGDRITFLGSEDFEPGDRVIVSFPGVHGRAWKLGENLRHGNLGFRKPEDAIKQFDVLKIFESHPQNIERPKFDLSTFAKHVD